MYPFYPVLLASLRQRHGIGPGDEVRYLMRPIKLDTLIKPTIPFVDSEIDRTKVPSLPTEGRRARGFTLPTVTIVGSVANYVTATVNG